MARFCLNRLWLIAAFLLFGFLLILWKSEDVVNPVDMTPSSSGPGVKYDPSVKDFKLPADQFLVVNPGGSSDDEEEATRTNLLSAMALDIMTNRSRTSPVNSTNKPAPPFRWCYDNDTMDEMIAEDLPCDVLFKGHDPQQNLSNEEAYNQAKERAKKWKAPCGDYTDKQVADLAATDCQLFLSSFNFVNSSTTGVPISEEESSFPLAYVFVVQKWAAQVMRVLSSVYRPHNAYCFTYDRHSSIYFKKAIKSAANCLRSNVFMSDRHFEIYWADISLLNATLNCMRMLVDLKHGWKYVQILSYNDFPLRTNLEMVRILSQFEGANDVELTRSQTERYVHYYKYAELDAEASKTARQIPPAGLVLYKGSFAATLSRQFIHFVFRDENAQRFLEWSVPTWAPEEQFWSTLVHNEHLGAPGHFPGPCLEYYRYAYLQKAWISRYQVWYHGCEGMYKSGSCIFGVGDLPMLSKRPELIAHKFYADYQPATFYCLAKRHYERTFLEEHRREFQKLPFDMDYYNNLPAVQYQKMKEKDRFNCAVVFTNIKSPV